MSCVKFLDVVILGRFEVEIVIAVNCFSIVALFVQPGFAGLTYIHMYSVRMYIVVFAGRSRS